MIEVSHFLISQEAGYQVIFANKDTGKTLYLVCPINQNLDIFKAEKLPIAIVETA